MGIIAVTGASGFIGSALVSTLREQGHRVRPLVRPGGLADDGIQWDPQRGTIDAAALEGLDALVHLSGESVAKRWTAEQKARIRDSRVTGTRLLAATLNSLTRKPAVWLSASAVGIYGDRGDELLDEQSSIGHDFLADVGVAWESAARPAAMAGIRVVHPRFGIVLGPRGGALQKMLPAFKLGLGGKLGSGKQYMSWVGLDDAVRALAHAIQHSELSGPVNITAPEPVTNAEFTRTLAEKVGRPAVFTVPGFAARLAFGEMADAALLGGQRVLPERLLSSGFEFAQPQLATCLDQVLPRA